MSKRIFALALALIMLLLVGCQPSNNDKGGTEGGENDDQSYYSDVTVSRLEYDRYRTIEAELGYTIIIGEPIISEEDSGTTYSLTIDTRYSRGVNYRILSDEEYAALIAYQNEHQIQVLYPVVKLKDRPTNMKNKYDGNIYFVMVDPDAKNVRPKLDGDGNIIPNYWKYEQDNMSVLIAEYDSLRIEGKDGFVEDGKTYFYAYGRLVDGGIEVRVDLYEYDKFYNYLVINNK